MNKSVKWIGMLVLGAFAFLAFLYWTFPYDVLKARVITTFERQLGGKWSVKIDELEPHWFSGVKLHDVQLLSRADTKAPPVLQAKEATARIGLLATLFGSPQANFAVELEKGDIEGSIQRKEDQTTIELELDALDLQAFRFIEDVSGLKLAGRLDGNVNVQLNLRAIKQAAGKIELMLDNWKILKGSQLKLGALGAMDLDSEFILSKGKDSVIKITMERGTAKIDTFRMKGGDIELDLKGQFFLERQFARSRINLKGTVKFSDKMKQIFPVEMLGASDPDSGTYPVEISGRMAKLRKRIGKFSF